jgi:hypothetical protein
VLVLYVLSSIVSSGKEAATELSILPIAGILPTPNGVVPDPGAASAIADTLFLVPDVNLTSPFTIPTVTCFSKRFPDV